MNKSRLRTICFVCLVIFILLILSCCSASLSTESVPVKKPVEQSEIETTTKPKPSQTTNNKSTSSSSLTNSDKKDICEFIQSRYDYYDSISGGYSGDKYTDAIWQEAMERYGLTESELDIIWMNMYSY